MPRKSAPKPKKKTAQSKSKAAKQRQKRLAIGLVAGLLVLLMVSTILAVPGVQDAVFRHTGIIEGISRMQPVSLEGNWDEEAAELPDLREMLTAMGPGSEAYPEDPQNQETGPAPDMTAAVHFLDVGQGDAVLLESGGEYALIDAGPPEGIDALMGYLTYLEVDSLKYLIMSHPHSDHIGGMQTVVEYLPVQQVLLPDFEKAPYPTTSTFENLLTAMLERELPTDTMKTGDSYTLGNGAIRVLADGLETEDNYNLLCPALLFETGDLRYLSTGDAEKENEAAILEMGADVNANLYKAAHHGSSTSNTATFLRAVRPWVTVVTCGGGNVYGHPHRAPLAAFDEVDSAVLRTDLDGFIRVSPDGTGGLQAATTIPREEEQSQAA